MVWRLISIAGLLFLTTVLACDFNPTAPFAGFDDKGSRVSGVFESEGSSLAQSTMAQSTFAGMVVFVRQQPDVTDSVKSNGSFTLVEIPQGTLTLVFKKDDAVIGEITLYDVLANQEIRIVVALTARDEVVLLDESRDAGDLGTCARGAGFWCQNQDGKNPNLSAERFEELALAASDLLKDVPSLASPDQIRTAVCNTGDQLLRNLATLALNLVAELVDEGTPIKGEAYGTVGEALEQAIRTATNPGSSRQERNSIKDVLDRINNNVNLEGSCSFEEPEDDDSTDDDPPPAGACSIGGDGMMTICHIPPGNPAAKHTLRIGAPAWPAHKGHGDTCGPCR